MRLEVTVQVIADDGVAFWGYSHQEVLIPHSEEPSENMTDYAMRAMDRIEDARTVIAEQAGVDLETLDRGEGEPNGGDG